MGLKRIIVVDGKARKKKATKRAKKKVAPKRRAKRKK